MIFQTPLRCEASLLRNNILLPSAIFYYSLLKLFTGLAMAALIAWKLTVNKAIQITRAAANAKVAILMLSCMDSFQATYLQPARLMV